MHLAQDSPFWSTLRELLQLIWFWGHCPPAALDPKASGTWLLNQVACLGNCLICGKGLFHLIGAVISKAVAGMGDLSALLSTSPCSFMNSHTTKAWKFPAMVNGYLLGNKLSRLFILHKPFFLNSRYQAKMFLHKLVSWMSIPQSPRKFALLNIIWIQVSLSTTPSH